MWNWWSFIIGFLVGLVISFIIVWILYATRAFVFSNCPNQAMMCHPNDYYNTPGEALANGASLEDILFIENGKMLYKRYKKNGQCHPGADQVIAVLNPQYCEIHPDGLNPIEIRSVAHNSYKYMTSNQDASYILNGHCKSKDGINGTPSLKWDIAN